MTTTQSQSKALVRQAFDTLFNKRDYATAERFWSPAYIQHSAHIAPGRDGLFELVRAAPKELRYENALIVADILRIENGLLAEHWDVIQDEATQEASKSGLPMFRDKFSGLNEWHSVPGMRKGPRCRRSWHGAMALFSVAALVLTDCDGGR